MDNTTKGFWYYLAEKFPTQKLIYPCQISSLRTWYKLSDDIWTNSVTSIVAEIKIFNFCHQNTENGLIGHNNITDYKNKSFSNFKTLYSLPNYMWLSLEYTIFKVSKV